MKTNFLIIVIIMWSGSLVINIREDVERIDFDLVFCASAIALAILLK